MVCVVVDEAHRATGNYAYTQVAKSLAERHQEFRVLGLTATPGASVDAVRNIDKNLHIANIQMRTEESIDVREYSLKKSVKKVVVNLDPEEYASASIISRLAQEFKIKAFQPMLTQLSKLPSGLREPNLDKVTTYGLTANQTWFTAAATNINNSVKAHTISLCLICAEISRAYHIFLNYGMHSFVKTLEHARNEALVFLKIK